MTPVHQIPVATLNVKAKKESKKYRSEKQKVHINSLWFRQS